MNGTPICYEFIPPSAGGIGWLRPLLFKGREMMPFLPNAVRRWMGKGQFIYSF